MFIGPETINAQLFKVFANGNAVVKVFDVSLLTGDANNDGLVTGADLIAVQQNFGTIGAANGHLNGDANDDGLVTGADLISVQQSFGQVLAPVAAPAGGVRTAVTGAANPPAPRTADGAGREVDEAQAGTAPVPASSRSILNRLIHRRQHRPPPRTDSIASRFLSGLHASARVDVLSLREPQDPCSRTCPRT